MKIVLDTNVWVSALISPKGTPALLVQKLESETFLISEEIVAEIIRVLAYAHIRERYQITDAIMDAYIEHIRETTTLIAPVESANPIVTADPTDDKFLLCALAGDADCVVSGDRHLKQIGLYAGIPILSPADLLAFVTIPVEQ